MRPHALTVAAVVALLGAMPAAAAAPTVSHVLVRRDVEVHRNVHLTFHARELPEGGYYYGVIVLKPYRHYTRERPPPCSTSSNMQRTAYGYPDADGRVTLALTPARSRTWHWCPGGSYAGAIYAVPHAPPCERRYPCRSEPYEPPSPCFELGEGRIACGLVEAVGGYVYPDPLPSPIASGTTIVAHFTVDFPRH